MQAVPMSSTLIKITKLFPTLSPGDGTCKQDDNWIKFHSL